MIKVSEVNNLLTNQIADDSNIINKAHARIIKYIYQTPLIYSAILSKQFGAYVYLKLDSMQVTGAFKIRGVLNYLLSLNEKNELPQKIVGYSTGNHALAMAYASNLFNIKARIYLPTYVSSTKKELLKSFGAEVIEVDNRSKAEELASRDTQDGYASLPPSDNDMVIAGAGTLCFEALKQLKNLNIEVDAIFAPCGGGGLLSGSYIAKELYSPQAKVYGVEPLTANDAARSVQDGSIFRFNTSPDTLADGLRTLGVSQRTFQYLQKLDDFYLVNEDEITYWNQYYNNIYPHIAEPSATISLAVAKKWAENNESGKVILLLISGGNCE